MSSRAPMSSLFYSAKLLGLCAAVVLAAATSATAARPLYLQVLAYKGRAA